MNSTASSPEPQGLASRRIAADILEGVLRRGRSLDDQLDGGGAHQGLASLPERDRALTRRLVATVLRRLGTLRHLLGLYLDRGIPADAPRVETALLLGAAQILWLDVPDHAAVDLSVRLVQADRRDAGYAGLVNAVLRRVAKNAAQQLRGRDTVALDTPDWLMARWQRAYGPELAHAIAAANGQEPALDLTVKSDPAHWANALGGQVLPTGSVRAIVHGPVPRLPGYADGAWWVQDAAAALPAQLLGDVRGKSVADLCAAPGGKTAQLAAAGARVTAVDRSAAAARAAEAEPRAARARRRNRRRRCHGVAVGAVRRRAARRALLGDRHHPPPSGYPLAQARIGHRNARRPAAPAAGARGRADASRAASSSIAPVRSSRTRAWSRSTELLARDSRVRRRPLAASEVARPRGVPRRRRRPPHAALPTA